MDITEKKKIKNEWRFVLGLIIVALLLAACGDARVVGSINTQPGASWQFQGNIEAIESPYWTVSRQRILVDEKTYIESSAPPAIGVPVSIEGRTLDNGVPNALIIKIVQPNSLPTVTPLVESADKWTPITPIPVPANSGAAGQPTRQPERAAAPAPAVVPSVPPPGTFVEIENVIQQVSAEPNFTVITVLGKPYILEQYMVRILGPRTVVGARIKFTARYNEAGQAIITKVVWINPPVVTNVAPPDNRGNSNDKDKGNDKKKNDD